ncbi:hypothetical protein Syun_006352 [Stephania yunnanensis]|uniref:Uncharacterized protein n=1 Tax=Stephania yunnanensis TaxID=152371 RepID=A0AAP0KWI8_9MAGN
MAQEATKSSYDDDPRDAEFEEDEANSSVTSKGVPGGENENDMEQQNEDRLEEQNLLDVESERQLEATSANHP